MKHLFISSVISSLIFVLSSALPARDMQEFTKNVPADPEVKKINLEADIGLAKLTVSVHTDGDIFKSLAEYDADRIEVDVEYDKMGSSADIYMKSEKIRRKLDFDTDDIEWEISLSADYSWDIDFDIGFGECEFDFSGLPMERLTLDVGASECRIVYDRPNPVVLKRFDVNAGAGELKLIGLGYANFRHVSFDGGAGDFVLNFEGFQEGFPTVQIDAGIGEVRLELPENLPVRIEADDSWLNSIDVRDADFYEIGEGVYESEDFEDASYGLEVDVDVGIGQLTIVRVD